jgi:hypothetical protein
MIIFIAIMVMIFLYANIFFFIMLVSNIMVPGPSKPIRYPLKVRIFSAEEIQYSEQFVPIAQMCRRKIHKGQKFCLVILATWLGIFIAAIIFSRNPEFFLILFPGIFIVLLLLGFSIYLFIYKPLSGVKCPACHNPFFAGKIEKYCPECGSKHLQEIKRGYRQCKACGITIYCSRQSFYKIRACRHCGVLLDAKGF